MRLEYRPHERSKRIVGDRKYLGARERGRRFFLLSARLTLRKIPSWGDLLSIVLRWGSRLSDLKKRRELRPHPSSVDPSAIIVPEREEVLPSGIDLDDLDEGRPPPVGQRLRQQLDQRLLDEHEPGLILLGLRNDAW